VNQLISNAKNNSNTANLNEDQFDDYLKSIGFKDVTSKIFDKYGLEEAEVRNKCVGWYGNHREIQSLLNQIDQIPDQLRAIREDLYTKLDIPEFLTPEVALELLAMVMKTSLKVIQAALKELKSQGEEISFNNPKTLTLLQGLHLEDVSKEIYLKAGLDKYGQPEKILKFTTKKYLNHNTNNFYNNFVQLEKDNKKAMDVVFSDPDGADEIIESIGKKLY